MSFFTESDRTGCELVKLSVIANYETLNTILRYVILHSRDQ